VTKRCCSLSGCSPLLDATRYSTTYKLALVALGKPRKLTPGTLFGRVTDIAGQQ
jgi:hypothetical protein